jgi:hypothetical protein
MSWLKGLFDGGRRATQQARKHLDEMDELLDDFEKSFDEEATKAAEQASQERAQPAAAAPGETVTTHREEVYPDGTRIVTTVTETGAVVTKETRPDGTCVTTTTTRTQARRVVTKEQR